MVDKNIPRHQLGVQLLEDAITARFIDRGEDRSEQDVVDAICQEVLDSISVETALDTLTEIYHQIDAACNRRGIE